MKVKYLANVLCFYEPDNNTPNTQNWVKIVECDSSKLKEMEEEIIKDMKEDCIDIEVELIPLNELKNTWRKITEIF